MTEDTPRRRPRWPRRTALAVALSLLACGLPAVLLADAAGRGTDRPTAAGRVDPTDRVTPADRAGAAYGIGYLAVRHLVDRYGEQRVRDFFGAALSGGPHRRGGVHAGVR